MGGGSTRTAASSVGGRRGPQAAPGTAASRSRSKASYVAALRDWVANGDKSDYVLSDEEFARRVKPRSPAEMEAEASFKLAVWFQQAGHAELAAKY